MDLYYFPLSCSMATKIALAEAGITARHIKVDMKTKQTADGADFRDINPLGQVPVLRTDDGDLVTENIAVLSYVAERSGRSRSESERTRTLQWLSFVGTELHKGIFGNLFNPALSDEVKAGFRERGASRFALLDRHLAGREFLLDRFTVADAYLVTVLNWTGFTGIDLAPWPNLVAYHARLLAHPSVAPVVAADRAAYGEDQAKQAA